MDHILSRLAKRWVHVSVSIVTTSPVASFANVERQHYERQRITLSLASPRRRSLQRRDMLFVSGRDPPRKGMLVDHLREN